MKENKCLLLNKKMIFFSHLLTAGISQFDGRSDMHSTVKKAMKRGYSVEWIKDFL